MSVYYRGEGGGGGLQFGSSGISRIAAAVLTHVDLKELSY